MALLTTTYVILGEFCYFVYGNDLTRPLIMSNWDDSKWYVITLKILYCINLIFTYPLMLFPAFQVMEAYAFKGWRSGKKRMWGKNIFRSIIVIFTIVLAIWLDEKLDKFLALLGGFACAPIAFTLPCLFHYKLCA